MSQLTATPVTTRGFFLDGKWIDQGETLEVRSPYDQTVVGQVVQGTREHAEAAIRAAIKAFGTTRRLPAFERQRVLRRVAQTAELSRPCASLTSFLDWRSTSRRTVRTSRSRRRRFCRTTRSTRLRR